MNKMNKIEFKNEGKKIELKIYGTIGNYWAKYDENRDENAVSTLEELDKQLRENKDASIIDVYINSSGGSVFDGVAIYNMLKRHKAYKRVFIEGFACSIASVIAMAGNTIVMPKSSIMMVHNAWTVSMGNAKELRKVADDLEKINDVIVESYMKKVNISQEEVKELMDKESYLTADECLEKGFCTKIDDSLDVSEEVEQALSEQVGLYQNKLETINRLKETIDSINASNEVETKEVEEEKVEVEKAKETEKNSKETNEVKENEVEQEVKNIKETAFESFFLIQK